MCCHDWQPLTIAHGRYECSMCGVKGYNLVVCADVNFAPNIVPYVCHHRDCNAEARVLVKIRGGFQGYCWEHRGKPAKPIDVKCPTCNAPGGGLCRKLALRPDEAKYCRMKGFHQERIAAAKQVFKEHPVVSVT